MNISRRSLLLSGLALLGITPLANKFLSKQKSIPGALLGASAKIGHQIKSGNFPAPTITIEKQVVIVGSGIAGLAAGYQFNKAGFSEFALLELEMQPGGNAQSGKNSISAYPWGAHYVPLLTEEAKEVRKLFEELGIITAYSDKGLPIYNDYFICQDPNERLFHLGRWQDGLVPTIGNTADDEAQYRKFFDFIGDLKNRRGKDGLKLFAIPVDTSSQDSNWLSLDAISMQTWLDEQGYTSKPLLWYVDYCCRDDFGTTLTDTSAWAGLHYFAARSGRAANTASDSVITWPEGNGWLAAALARPTQDQILTDALCYSVREQNSGVEIDYLDVAKHETVRIKAKAVILATPRFIASRLLKSNKFSINADHFTYSPWAVANVTVSRLPKGKGAPLSWDNVVYGSPFIGYVNAGHQITQMTPVSTVLTYYWPLSHLPPEQARAEAINRTYAEWQTLFLEELLRIHPELEGYIERVDIWLWGHGMIRPTPGFIWGTRRTSLKQHPPLFTAHSDMSGISIFEEAYTRGVKVADEVLGYLKQTGDNA